MIGCNLGADISDHLIGRPDVPADHLHHGLIEHPSVVELHEGNEESFLEDIMVVRGDATPDIRMMKNAGRKSHHLDFYRRSGSSHRRRSDGLPGPRGRW